MKNKVVVFIDVVAAKNKLQIDIVQQMQMQLFCFVSHYREASDAYFTTANAQVKLEETFFKRCLQVFSFLKKNYKTIHHIELFPGGRFSFVYVLMAKFFFIKTICGERGDLLYYNKNGYSLMTRISMWFCYKFSDLVCYREIYMLPMLEKIRKQGLFFLHNSIEISRADILNNTVQKDINFLWLNRVIPQRKYEWFIEILKEEKLKGTNNLLVGLLNSTAFNKDQQYVINNRSSNLQILEYSSQPSSFYKRAKFFVLPSEVVFANNALLEAMTYGVVPLVSRQPGSELIVEDNKSGFVFDHSLQGFRTAVYKAMDLTDEKYLEMSAAAKEKVAKDFSGDEYRKGLMELYNKLN